MRQRLCFVDTNAAEVPYTATLHQLASFTYRHRLPGMQCLKISPLNTKPKPKQIQNSFTVRFTYKLTSTRQIGAEENDPSAIAKLQNIWHTEKQTYPLSLS